jgi:hypothetical protein
MVWLGYILPPRPSAPLRASDLKGTPMADNEAPQAPSEDAESGNDAALAQNYLRRAKKSIQDESPEGAARTRAFIDLASAHATLSLAEAIRSSKA